MQHFFNARASNVIMIGQDWVGLNGSVNAFRISLPNGLMSGFYGLVSYDYCIGKIQS